jgi:hypothetical protein
MVRARQLQQHGLVESAVLHLQGRMLTLQPRMALATETLA